MLSIVKNQTTAPKWSHLCWAPRHRTNSVTALLSGRWDLTPASQGVLIGTREVAA